MKQSTKDKIAQIKHKLRDLLTPKAKRRLAIALSILLIGGAVYLNWLFFFADKSNGIYDGFDATGGEPSDYLGAAVQVGGDVAGEKIAAEDNGAASVASYFAVTTINRQRARDEAIEVLQNIIDDVNATEEERRAALDDMRNIAMNIENEANIEALVEARGISDCVAVISNGYCTVVVESNGLMPNEVAQIQEIVYEVASIPPANLKIVEKSA
ncbi:MAG TPA: SpoIIIAH-like family protein [Bacillota bacterium]|nr:SpoIIIAH-like family protein [Clostridiales bacterium]HPT84562.1 SpoIIIAH-like family protein [Bacillota bacterium]